MISSKRDHSPEHYAIAEKYGEVDCAVFYFDMAYVDTFGVTDRAFRRKYKFALLERIFSHNSLNWNVLFLIIRCI